MSDVTAAVNSSLNSVSGTLDLVANAARNGAADAQRGGHQGPVKQQPVPFSGRLPSHVRDLVRRCVSRGFRGAGYSAE